MILQLVLFSLYSVSCLGALNHQGTPCSQRWFNHRVGQLIEFRFVFDFGIQRFWKCNVAFCSFKVLHCFPSYITSPTGRRCCSPEGFLCPWSKMEWNIRTTLGFWFALNGQIHTKIKSQSVTMSKVNINSWESNRVLVSILELCIRS